MASNNGKRQTILFTQERLPICFPSSHSQFFVCCFIWWDETFGWAERRKRLVSQKFEIRKFEIRKGGAALNHFGFLLFPLRLFRISDFVFRIFCRYCGFGFSPNGTISISIRSFHCSNQI